MDGIGGYGTIENARPTASGGGAGNPGGNGAGDGTIYPGYSGTTGTGGLLIIKSNEIVNKGIISSNGSAGGSAYFNGGGGSGGGSINVFYEKIINKGNINATGGSGGRGRNWSGLNNFGGSGGTGTITVGNISTGTFIKDE